MAYSFISAIGLTLDPAIGWVDVLPNVDLLETLTTQYKTVYVKLSNVMLADPIVIDLKHEVGPGGSLANPNITIATWLSAIGNPVLQSLGKDYTVSTKRVNTGAASRYGYKFQTVHPTAALDVEVLDSDRTDLLITKAGVDYQYMATHSLISINGYLHVTDGSDHGLYVRKARVTRDISKDNQVGIISFADIGALQQIPITVNMLFAPTGGAGNWVENLTIDLGVSTQNKTVMLSIGGYLHVLDDTYEEVGDGLIRLRWDRLAIAERFFESKKHISLDTISNLHYQGYNNTLMVNTLRQQQFITEYLTLPQSFAIVVDAPVLTVKQGVLGRSHSPGVHITPYEPRGIVRSRYGRCLNYWKKKDWGSWVITTTPEFDYVSLFQTTDWLDTTVIIEGKDPNRKTMVDRAYLLQIQKQTLTIAP